MEFQFLKTWQSSQNGDDPQWSGTQAGNHGETMRKLKLGKMLHEKKTAKRKL